MAVSTRLAARTLAVTAALLTVFAAGCGNPARSGSAAPISAGESPSETTSAPSAEQSSAAASSAAPSSAAPGAVPGAAVRRAFPVVGKASYARTHHDYPASDIIAPCGATALAAVDGVVLEVNRVDTFDRKVNAGATRGGLSISLLGDDGVRYYGSHYASIDGGIEPGARVRAGQPIGKVGRTGDAGACHVHFGISPPCTRTGDWWTRRGVIFPWPYLDSWRAGGNRSPVTEIESWRAKHGCPAKPLTP
jgi:murein DD-endopeptidase MepM/ murein hydrolase activator NlpD